VHDVFRAAGRVAQDQGMVSDAGQGGYSPQKFGIKHKEVELLEDEANPRPGDSAAWCGKDLRLIAEETLRRVLGRLPKELGSFCVPILAISASARSRRSECADSRTFPNTSSSVRCPLHARHSTSESAKLP
jgi:hypothetical protein